jgi:hypothetical protein
MAARGEYRLPPNDDPIAAPALLAEHWNLHHAQPNAWQCLPGDFRFPGAAQQRALVKDRKQEFEQLLVSQICGFVADVEAEAGHSPPAALRAEIVPGEAYI